MREITRMSSIGIWLLIVLSLSGMPEDKIPADVRTYRELFRSQDSASAYATLENWVFEKGKTNQETARRIVVARDIIVGSNDQPSDYQQWVDPLIKRINADEGDNWLAHRAVALTFDFYSLENKGVIANGEFLSGKETGGPMRYSVERDRFHAISHYLRAIALCRRAIDAGNVKADDLADLYLRLADCIE